MLFVGCMTSVRQEGVSLLLIDIEGAPRHPIAALTMKMIFKWTPSMEAYNGRRCLEVLSKGIPPCGVPWPPW